MPRNYWMLVISPDNFCITRDLGFTVQGLPAPLRRKAERIGEGDRMLFYLSRAQRFAATATVTSACFEDHSPIWKNHKPGEDYPYRVHIEPAVVLDEAEFLDAREVGPRMEYVKKWVPERWPLAFQGDLHLIPRRDFSLIEEEMKKQVSARTRHHCSRQSGAHRHPRNGQPTSTREAPAPPDEAASAETLGPVTPSE